MCFQMKPSGILQNYGDGGTKALLAPYLLPLSYGGLETKKTLFKRILLKIAFYRKYYSSFISAGVFGRKNTNIGVTRTPHYHNTNLKIFFIRNNNSCLRLDAQNYDIHPRLSLFLTCSYFKNS